MIEIKNLSFSYSKNKKVLDDISFSINEGEIVLLLGPNGAGKSTLLNCLIGEEKIASGEILFDGKNRKEISREERNNLLGYVPQLIEGNDLTVRETILLGRLNKFSLYPSKKDYELVDSLIESLNLSELKDRTTSSLSGGERQKVAIARAIIQESNTILFDEPTSNLDIKAQLEVLKIIKDEIKSKNKSALISMHDINQALSIGDKFIFLVDNQVKAVVKKEEITPKLLEETYGIKSRIIKVDNKEIIVYED